ncbi:MAG: M14 family metallopeptidase [Gammaproteobacteria bacterium]|jgi:succinylglutamate desuccinylase
MTKLNQIQEIPDGLLEVGARELHTVLPGPTLMHLPGRREAPLFVSVLLHGNEDAGLAAIQHVLRRYTDQPLPRALSVFFGNVSAAREGLRALDGQPDYNRIWPGGDAPDSPERRMMAEVVDIMRERNIFASIDVHNNTGLNPHYACINHLDDRFMQLASLFGRTVVYFIRPRGVQSMALAELCPATTLECGKPGVAAGAEHAAEFIEACLNLAEIPDHPVAAHDIDLFHTVATVKVPEPFSFSFDHGAVDIAFDAEIDHYNFRELAVGTRFGVLRPDSQARLEARDEEGQDVTDRFFSHVDGHITLIRPSMPSMLTLDTRIVRQDCLCYLMERLSARGEE